MEWTLLDGVVFLRRWFRKSMGVRYTCMRIVLSWLFLYSVSYGFYIFWLLYCGLSIIMF